MKRKKKRKRKNSKNWNEKERLDENGSSWIELFFKWDEPVVAILQLAPFWSRVLGRQEIRHYSYSLLSRISLREFNVESSHRAALRWFQDFTRAQRRTGEREGDEEKEKKKLNKIKEIFLSFLILFFKLNLPLIPENASWAILSRKLLWRQRDLGKNVGQTDFSAFFQFFFSFFQFFQLFQLFSSFFSECGKAVFPYFLQNLFQPILLVFLSEDFPLSSWCPLHKWPCSRSVFSKKISLFELLLFFIYLFLQDLNKKNIRRSRQCPNQNSDWNMKSEISWLQTK